MQVFCVEPEPQNALSLLWLPCNGPARITKRLGFPSRKVPSDWEAFLCVCIGWGRDLDCSEGPEESNRLCARHALSALAEFEPGEDDTHEVDLNSHRLAPPAARRHDIDLLKARCHTVKAAAVTAPWHHQHSRSRWCKGQVDT